MKEDLAILTVNSKQKKVLKFLEKVGLIHINSAQKIQHVLSDSAICEFAYISGFRPVVKKVYELFLNGFLVSKDGQDRLSYNRMVRMIEQYYNKNGG